MARVVAMVVRVGEVYEWKGNPKHSGGTLYQVIGFIRDATLQPQLVECPREDIAYVGLDGKDEGVWYHCPLNNFYAKFKKTLFVGPTLDGSPAPPSVPEKVAGKYCAGSGV